MSKIPVALLCLLVSLPACAEWLSYKRTPDTDELYDSAFVSREGKRVKLWTLTDYAKPITSLEGQELLSEKALTTVDCDARKVGSEKVLKFTEAHGKGSLVGAMETSLRLTTVRPGSADEALLEKVCR